MVEILLPPEEETRETGSNHDDKTSHHLIHGGSALRQGYEHKG